MMSLSQANAMDAAGFTAQFGDIAEHSPWVSAQVRRPFATRAAMVEAFAHVVMTAPPALQLSLLQAHPDLATRARLTPESTREQKGAGLDSLTVDEFARFTALNERYKRQNGFPFIFAVKGATKHQILASFEDRIHHSREIEFEVALEQVCKIIGFRLDAQVAE